MSKFQDLQKRMQGEREGRWLVRHGSYLFDRRVFFAVLIILVGWCALALSESGFSTQYYASCPPDRFVGCVNPYYECASPQELWGCTCMVDAPEPCSWPLVMGAGSSYGTPPAFFSRSLLLATLLFSLSAFLINHVMHNRRRTR